MEITIEQINEALNANPEFINGVLPIVTNSEVGKQLIENRAKLMSDERIGDEVKKIHTQYDNDIFEVLGERAGTDESGNKMKTYDFNKRMLSELKDFRSKKSELEKDTLVSQLKSDIEKLKSEGGGKHMTEIHEKAKSEWLNEREGYLKQIQDAKTENEVFQKTTAIKAAFAELKYNPDTPDSVKQMILQNVEQNLLKNSKFEDGKLIFVGSDGKPEMDQTSFTPKTAFQMLMSMDAIKDITLKDGNKTGGNANVEINGSIETRTIEGKEVKKLVLPTGSFKTKVEFVNIVEKALTESGITRRDPNWTLLFNEAAKEHNYLSLPAQ